MGLAPHYFFTMKEKTINILLVLCGVVIASSLGVIIYLIVGTEWEYCTTVEERIGFGEMNITKKCFETRQAREEYKLNRTLAHKSISSSSSVYSPSLVSNWSFSFNSSSN